MGFFVPTYLYHTPSGYIFRLCIPRDLRAVVGKTEFRYSLRSGRLVVAKHRAQSIASYIHQLFVTLRNNMASFTKEKINQLVREYIKQTLEDDEKCRALGQHAMSELYVTGGCGMGLKEAESLDITVKRMLKDKDHSLLHPAAENLLSKHGIELDPESESFKTLSRELMVAFQSILKVRKKRSEGDYTVPDEELIPSLKDEAAPKQEQSVQSEQPKALTFCEVQEKYLVEVEVSNSWTPKTKEENLAIFALFVNVMGDLPMDQITRALISEYKSMLMQLPPNLSKNKKFQGMSIKEIIASKPGKTLSINSINKYIRRMSGLFNYALKNGYIVSNPASDMQIKNKKRPDQEREAFTQDDLIKLFHSREYLEGKHREPYAFWTPLIALYSGCRLEEICQLHLEDIRQEDGVWVFDINDEKEKKLKNRSSVRLVPVHKQLIDIGLLGYVEKLKAKGYERLFPELRQRRDGYGQTVSKWFARYKKRCGVEGPTFHSFRHTFITHLKHKQVDHVMIHELDGHTLDSEFSRYGKRYTADILLREAIEKVDYDIDMSEIKHAD